MNDLEWMIEGLIHAKGVVGRIGRGHTLAEGVGALEDLLKEVESYREHIELPVIPSQVAELIESTKRNDTGIDWVFGELELMNQGKIQWDGALEWVYHNMDKFLRAWMDGYKWK